ncbi:MAG TPA: hypothetical protein PL155_03990 [Candidatus Omnitrophota bacterium]|nr:hypothetical protein [Candidatus Omnitrophota bacterium]HPD84364.1 hypothetical protein [Candidatus Omnitrophota bacterium]HRZ03222.1 hypothetical protein [Candidatus Omnitrophota bacterium]
MATHKYLNSKLILTAFLLFVISLNFSSLKEAYRSVAFHRASRIFRKSPGFEFADFKDKLTGINAIGFLTDKNMSPERNDGQFLAAQYTLAPVILDLNNPNYRLNILDCTNLADAFGIMQGISAEPAFINPYGKILAQRGL